MSPQLIRTLIAGALFVHGVGHTLGFWMPTRSWVLGRFMGEPTLRVVSSVFWVVSAMGFVAARIAFLGILLPHEWWRSLALATAVVSLVGLVVFIGNWPAFNTIGALGINVAVLVALLWAKWPPEALIGR
ncbi:MAG: hypothetical protein NTY23_03160 [Chloroflexi bacterium]|nr:hypothetical protein [Chloroflexota bacterium]